MKIIFLGTSEFAVPALRALREAKYDITAVVTQPDKPAGRKQELLPSPVKQAALKMGLKVVQPPVLNSKFEIRNSDLFVVASYGKIIPKAILDIPTFGTLNIHPSLLPRYRGPSPIQATILNGDSETGVTVIKLDEEMDHGDIVASEKWKVKSRKFKDLHDELAEAGANLLVKILPKYIAGEIKPVPQDHSKATFTKIITKDDARINWTKLAEEIDRTVRAYSEWPVAWTTLEEKRLKIYEAAACLPPLARGGKEGEVVTTADGLVVRCGSSYLQIISLQLEGARVMTAKDFLNGNPGLAGKVLV